MVNNIILSGPPNCGKTTSGKILAELIGWNFLDIDQKIESIHHKSSGKKESCRTIFQTYGESYFRNIEKKAISELKEVQNSVIALGGGALLDSENSELLKTLGRVVYLKTPIETLWKRMDPNNSFSFIDNSDLKASFLKSMEERASSCESAADKILEAKNLSQKEIAFFIAGEMYGKQ